MLVAADMDFPPVEAPIIPVQALEYSGTESVLSHVIGEITKATRTEVAGCSVLITSWLIKASRLVRRSLVQGIVNMRDGVLVQNCR